MKLRCLLPVCLLACLLLAACQTDNQGSKEEHTSAVTEVPTNQIPSEINFEVNCVCEPELFTPMSVKS